MYAVEDVWAEGQAKGNKASWTKIGAAWPNADGKGFSIASPAFRSMAGSPCAKRPKTRSRGNEPLPSAVAQLNDLLRKHFVGRSDLVLAPSHMLITPGVGALSHPDFELLIGQAETFHAFTDDKDPRGEHDFGAMELAGARYFWKIDYYDLTKSRHSPDPSDPGVTCRALTIMRADEF